MKRILCFKWIIGSVVVVLVILFLLERFTDWLFWDRAEEFYYYSMIIIGFVTLYVLYATLSRSTLISETRMTNEYCSQYYSPDMVRYVKLLAKFEEDIQLKQSVCNNRTIWRINLDRYYRNVDGRISFRIADSLVISTECDIARRQLESYYYMAMRMYESGAISKKALKVIVDNAGFRLLFDVVEPLEYALNPEYDGHHFYMLMSVCRDLYMRRKMISFHFRQSSKKMYFSLFKV